MAWDTAANILNDAAVELGLYATDLADPYDSTDANVVQLRRLLKSVGQDLARDYVWSHLQKEHTFQTEDGVVGYDAPSDFLRLLDQTQWNRSEQERLEGPLSAQGWQYLKALSASGTSESWFRVFGTELRLYPTPSSAETVAFEYASSYWVQPTGQTTPTTDAPTDGTDTLWFDRRLLVCAVKLAFRRSKGFDTASVQEDFDRALSRAMGGDGAAPVLSLNHRGVFGQRLIGPDNLPDTGMGS